MLKLKLQYLASWCKVPSHWERPWCWERLKAKGKGAAEDEMVGWHHWLDVHESEQRFDSFEKTLMLERLKAGGEGDDRGWDGWMASPTRCTWIWVSSRSGWWTGKPGTLQFLGSQWVGHDWVTELNWTEPGWGLGSCRRTQRYCYYIPWIETRTQTQGYTIVSSLLFLCFCFRWLATLWICLLERNKGGRDWMKPISYK